MDRRVTKLNHYLDDTDLAAELVELGLDTPRKIKAEMKTSLNKKIGKAKADKVKGKIK